MTGGRVDACPSCPHRAHLGPCAARSGGTACACACTRTTLPCSDAVERGLPEEPARLTRQGVRDLNPPGQSNPTRHPRRRVLGRCHHVWDDVRGYDCESGEVVHYRHCGLCHETRREEDAR